MSDTPDEPAAAPAPEHTDPIRLVLSLEQLRDPILLAMGRQVSMKDRELALADAEIRRLQRRVGELEESLRLQQARGVRHLVVTAELSPADIAIMGEARAIEPVKVVPLPAPKADPDKWLITMLRDAGPLTLEAMAARRGIGESGVRVALRGVRHLIDDDGKRPRTYWLKAVEKSA